MTAAQNQLESARQQFIREVEALRAAATNADGTPNDTLSPEMLAAYGVLAGYAGGSLWHLYDDKGRLHPRLQYLYARRHVYGILMGGVALDVTYGEAGVTESLSDESKNFLTNYQNADAEIKTLESQLRANSGIALGQMTTTQPRQPCAPWSPNPAGGYYRGDPLSRGPWDR